MNANAISHVVDGPAEARSSGVHRTSPALEQVTLIVYGWKSADPGTLSWVFPSVDAALVAARAMTNAVNWAIVAGAPPCDDFLFVDGSIARANGCVLVEQ